MLKKNNNNRNLVMEYVKGTWKTTERAPSGQN